MASLSNSAETGLGENPPFPADLPVAQISNISHQKLLEGDVHEITKLIQSAREIGFFRVDFRDSEVGRRFLAAANNMFALAEDTFNLPTETKLADNFLKHGDLLLGYKSLGASVVDKEGTPDNNEQYWIGCGDIEGRAHSRAVYNEVINSRMEHLQEFIDLGRIVTDKFLAIISAILGLGPEHKDYLQKLHSHSNNSGSHVRLLKCPPKPGNTNISLQPHTDWGTFTVLFNQLGGLQIWSPDSLLAPGEEPGWRWVKPEPGMAVINLGDAFVKWSNGELKSTIHRVSNPPGEQANHVRYSLAYFTRPDNDVLLKPLGRKFVPSDANVEFPTFKEWALRRAMAGRTDGFKEGDWEKGQGTETIMSARARIMV
ncbi:hypothetical protein F4803DRAFT_571703 [Xylaria telfairii]|nr:hypothetical protein F4803DRAFT_571703 [Xylaria telfairii]